MCVVSDLGSASVKQETVIENFSSLENPDDFEEAVALVKNYDLIVNEDDL